MAIVRLELGDRGRAEPPVDEATHLDALRLRAAEALERSYRFLSSAGDDWALLRAQVLCGARPAQALAERLAAAQHEDGRFPLATLVRGGGLGFSSLEPARLDARGRALVGTLEAFLMAADAGVLYGAWLERAARAIEGLQAPDGAFRATGAPDDVFLTGMVAGMLGRTPLSRPETLERAGAFLAARFTPDAVEHEGYPALLAYALFFTNVGHELSDEALQWCGRALEKGFRSRRLDAVATLRVLVACDAQALPGATFDVVELLERLLGEQARDGGFAELALGGVASRTTQTFDAMLGIVRLCAALGAATGGSPPPAASPRRA